jgi:hypothetical protein
MLVRPLSVLLAVMTSIGFGAAHPSKQFHQATQQEIQASQEVPEVQTAEAESFMRDLDTYVQKLQLLDYLAAIEASQKAEEAARSAMATSRSYTPVSNNGAHSDAWWHGVSVCEQGGRNDPYFGYFSIMDGRAGGLDWNTQVAMANSIIASYGDGAWAASCVAAGYAASPSG